MVGSGHFIYKCRQCERVTSQCRCPGPKETRYTDCCAWCDNKEKDDLPNRKPKKS